MSKTIKRIISISLCLVLTLGISALCGKAISDLFLFKADAATQISITSEEAAKWAADNFRDCYDFDGTNYNVTEPTWGDPQCVDLIKW